MMLMLPSQLDIYDHESVNFTGMALRGYLHHDAGRCKSGEGNKTTSRPWLARGK